MNMAVEKRIHDDVIDALAVFGRVQANESLARHTSLRIGGPADYLVTPASARTVPGLLSAARALGLPITVLGNGTNTLVLDGGIRGVVIRLSACARITLLGDDTLVAEGGVPFPRLAREAMRCSLSGLEFAAGIPGTVGGAVTMNAGAHGTSLGDVLECIDMATFSGDVLTLPADRLGLAYRKSSLPEGVVLTAVFSLKPGDPAQIAERTEANLDRRNLTQPILTPNAGSFFKNPPGDYAARLIEAAGCKGWEEGDAAISEKHANFLVNHGRASAAQVLALADRVREEVARRFDVTLEMEVKPIGEAAP